MSNKEKKVKRYKRINPEQGFNETMRGKLVVLYFIVLLAFIGLMIRLVVITNDNGDQYKKQVLSQQRYASTTIPYKRGDIFDSKGNKLATSEKVYNLIVDAKVMSVDKDKTDEEEKDKTLKETIKALRSSFPGLDVNEIETYVRNNPEKQYKIFKKQLSYDEISDFVEIDNKEDKVAGVWFEPEYKRIYPNNELACDAIGFFIKGEGGQYGLEQYYNDVLSGSDGRTYGYLNEQETLERTTIPATDGFNIVTTIDANVQQIVERKLKDFNDENTNAARDGNGANNLGCIIMDVDSGEILAMASYPNFDLNNTRDINRLIGSKKVELDGRTPYDAVVLTSENIEEELADEELLKANYANLWKNFCISNTYEPGSTYKPFTVACGLECGKLTGEEYYTCNGALPVGPHNIKCHNYKKGGCGTLDVKGAVENSCNVSLMLMGRQIGQSRFLEYQNKYNFGLKTNVDLYGESRTDSLIFNNDTMGETELATSTFGQGFNVTMIQMITGFCSLINGGYYYEPHMVSKITAADGSVVKTISPRVLKQTISAQTSNKIIDYCVGVVQEGTGKTARPAGYMIGGKTGTAETVPRDRTNYILSFMGFAPADNPQIAIYVVVDRPNSWVQDNVGFATRLCRGILTEVLPYMNIYMTEELSDKEKKELEEMNISIKRPEDEVEEEEGSNEVVLEKDENGNIDAHGGDVTSSTPVSAEEMQSDNVATAPLTGTVLDIETGEAVKGETDEIPY